MSGPLSFDVSIDLGPMRQRLGKAALRKAQTVLAMRVGFDSNKYVKVETRQTQQSMQAASDFEEGEVRWDTPWAKYAYYDPNVVPTLNPYASSRWFEKAKQLHLDSWKKYAAGVI